jgi:hypothetical protein
MLVSYPLMAGIQEISARIGLVTAHGLAADLRKHDPPALLHVSSFCSSSPTSSTSALPSGPWLRRCACSSAARVGRDARALIRAVVGVDRGPGRHLRHDDQPLPVLLVGR